LKFKLIFFSILLYFQTNCSKKNIEIEITRLSKKINETSGLEVINEYFVTINDSGDGPVLYTFDKNGKNLSEKLILGAKNTDWESLASDNKYLYIGDIGNNKGNRKDLKIYITDFEFKLIDSINFNYNNQLSFKKKKKHKFDAEALVSFNDSLLVFSKNRKALTTEVYILPKKPGSFSLQPKYSFNVDALITGADYNFKLDLLAFVGYSYNIKKQFLFVFKDFKDNINKQANFKKYIIPITNAQIEAIKIITEKKFWLTSENEGGGYPKLITVKLK
tara:strand:+ start:77 stop:904 length:828 start_codon:yes stop_codon:yes gene_type:complete